MFRRKSISSSGSEKTRVSECIGLRAELSTRPLWLRPMVAMLEPPGIWDAKGSSGGEIREGGASSGGEGNGEGGAAGSAAWHLPAPSSRSNSFA